MKKVVGVFLFLGSLSLYGQENPGKAKYEAWRDSVQNPNYIMSHVVYLDEMMVQESVDSTGFSENRDGLIATDNLMHKLPGLNMMRRGNYANEPVLRGLSSERYVVTIDGMRMFGACTDKMDPVSSYMEPNNLSELNINLGGHSETELFSGSSVSFQLKKAIYNNEKPVMAGAGLKYSSASRGFDQLADVNLNKGKWALRMSFVHRKAQNYLAGDKKEVRYSQFEKYNYMITTSRKFSREQMLSFIFLGDDGFHIGYPALPMDVAYAKAKIYALQYYVSEWNFLSDIEMKAYFNHIDHAMDDTHRDPADVTMHMDMPGISSTAGFYAKSKLSKNLRGRVEFFRSFARAEMTMYADNSSPMFLLTFPDVLTNSGLMQLNHIKKTGTKWEISNTGSIQYFSSYSISDFGIQQLSVFYEDPGRRYDNVLYNYSGKVTRKTGSALKMNYLINYLERGPSTGEKYGYYLFNREDGYDYIGNPALKKEASLQNELQGSWYNERMTMSLSIFHYQYFNYILGMPDPNIGVMTPGANGVKLYANSGNATLWGGEATLMANLTKDFHFMTSLNVSSGWDFEKDPLPLIPPFKTNNTLQYDLKDLQLYANFVWAASQSQISSKYGEDKTSSFSVINAGGTKTIHIKNGQLDIGTGVENILDNTYHEHTDWGNIPRPGRNFYVHIAWRNAH